MASGKIENFIAKQAIYGFNAFKYKAALYRFQIKDDLKAARRSAT